MKSGTKCTVRILLITLLLMLTFAAAAQAVETESGMDIISANTDLKIGDMLHIKLTPVKFIGSSYTEYLSSKEYEWSYYTYPDNDWIFIDRTDTPELYWTPPYNTAKIECMVRYVIRYKVPGLTIPQYTDEYKYIRTYDINMIPTLTAETVSSKINVDQYEPLDIEVKASGNGEISYNWLVIPETRLRPKTPYASLSSYYRNAIIEGEKTNHLKMWFDAPLARSDASQAGSIYCRILTSLGEAKVVGPFKPQVSDKINISDFTAKYDRNTDLITLWFKDQQTDLKEGTDFTATRNPSARFMKLTITGIGNCKGTFSASINVDAGNANSSARPVSDTITSNAAAGSGIRTSQYVHYGKNTGHRLSGTGRFANKESKASSSESSAQAATEEKAPEQASSAQTSTQAAQLDTPVISSASNTFNGISLKWNAVNGAEKYRIFKQKDTGGWSSVGTTTTNKATVPADKLDSGKTYVFTVRCEDPNVEKKYVSDYDRTGYSITYIAAPKLVSANASSKAGQVKVTWEASAGAEQYRVFYKEEGAEKWSKAKLTTDTQQTVKNLDSGKTYYFTVRCVNADATAYTSGYDKTGLSAKVK